MIASQTAAAPVRKLKLPPELAAAEKLEKTGPIFIDAKSIELGDNPRETFDADELKALAASMGRITLLAPLTVTPAGPGSYRLVAGERRLRAARIAGWKKLPAYVVSGPNELLVEMQQMENLLRVDLNPIEKARAYEMLVRPQASGGAGYAQNELAERLGISPCHVSNTIRLLKLPADWQQRIARGEIGFRQAKAAVAYADRPDVLAAAAEDLARNPEDWASAADFDRQLAFVVERLDALTAGDSWPSAEAAEEGAASGAFPQGTAPAHDGPATLPLQRRSSPVRHDLAGEDRDRAALPSVDASSLLGRSDRPADPVEAIAPLIEQLSTLGQVERVERLLRRREAKLARGD